MLQRPTQTAAFWRDKFEVGANDQVEQRKIETGRHIGEAVEIIAGLTPNAKVVSRGAAFLNPGDRVQIATDTAPAKGKAAAK